MTRDGWQEVVLNATERADAGDLRPLDLLAALLEEQDAAKQVLREKGYGCTGMGWLETVSEVPAIRKAS